MNWYLAELAEQFLIPNLHSVAELWIRDEINFTAQNNIISVCFWFMRKCLNNVTICLRLLFCARLRLLFGILSESRDMQSHRKIWEIFSCSEIFQYNSTNCVSKSSSQDWRVRDKLDWKEIGIAFSLQKSRPWEIKYGNKKCWNYILHCRDQTAVQPSLAAWVTQRQILLQQSSYHIGWTIIVYLADWCALPCGPEIAFAYPLLLFLFSQYQL